ncbi:zinc finger CCHC domain protein [Fagus crenata]
MAETPLKRQREETQMEDCEESKRHKSYSHILSLLEAEEEEPNQDLSSLITTLQQELSSDSHSIPDPLPFTTTETDTENPTKDQNFASSSSSSSSSSQTKLLKEDEEEEDDKGRVIRHLLEASDDELGIPNREVGVGLVFDGIEGFNGGDGYSFCEGLWELEDEAANYYTLLQSELFM